MPSHRPGMGSCCETKVGFVVAHCRVQLSTQRPTVEEGKCLQPNARSKNMRLRSAVRLLAKTADFMASRDRACVR